MKSYFYVGRSVYYGSILVNSTVFAVDFPIRYTNEECNIIYNLDTLLHYMNDGDDSVVGKYTNFTDIKSEVSFWYRNIGRYHSDDERVLNLNQDQFKLSIGNIFMVD